MVPVNNVWFAAPPLAFLADDDCLLACFRLCLPTPPFSSQGRFQLGAIDDAAEALDAMLSSIHIEAVENGADKRVWLFSRLSGALEDWVARTLQPLLISCLSLPRPLFLTGCTQPQQDGDVGTGFEAVEDACDPPCIAHKVFGLSLMEMTECGACGSNSEPFLYTKFMHYVSSVALIQYGGSLIVVLSYWGGVFVVGRRVSNGGDCCWESRFIWGASGERGSAPPVLTCCQLFDFPRCCHRST